VYGNRKMLKAAVAGVFENASFILGYGSGVFRQAGRPKGLPDLLVVTADVERFHSHNMTKYPEHYSRLALLSPTSVSYINRTSPYAHFALNANLPTGLICKYGVVDFRDLRNVLESWESLHIPGRLQKPVELLECSDKSAYDSLLPQLNANRITALRLAAVLSSMNCSTFTIDQLLNQLVGLSYLGDLRMGLAEAPTKVSDIVRGQFSELKTIYLPFFANARVSEVPGGLLKLDEPLTDSINRLPRVLQPALPARFAAESVAEVIRRVKMINRRDSAAQAIKGALTSPLSNVVSYLSRKVLKRLAL
jgi:Phosphatidate cytidylyltransferase, mitochondrial